MLRCKQGELAWITGDPNNQGKLVDVLRPAPPCVPGSEPAFYGPCWIIKSLSGPMEAVRHNEEVLVMEGSCPDAWLTPQRPGTAPVDASRELETV